MNKAGMEMRMYKSHKKQNKGQKNGFYW